MKNNFKIIIILIHFIFVQNIVFSKEINFKANEILTYDTENTIVGKDNAEAKIDDANAQSMGEPAPVPTACSLDDPDCEACQ